jgi:hypothetical protein
MRFAFQGAGGAYEVVRITDNGRASDTYAEGSAATVAEALSWVNTGAVGSGHPIGWQFFDVFGSFTVAP